MTPASLSMIGYDDVFAGSLAPPLTSVHLLLPSVTEQAIHMLDHAVDTPAHSRQSSQVVLPTIFVKRGSVQRMAVV